MPSKRVFLGDVEVPLDELEEKLRTNAKAQADKEIYLHADKDDSLRGGGGGDGRRPAGGHRQPGHDHRPGLLGPKEERTRAMPTLTSTVPVSLLVRRPDAAFGKFLFWSALVHAVLFALALVYAVAARGAGHRPQPEADQGHPGPAGQAAGREAAPPHRGAPASADWSRRPPSRWRRPSLPKSAAPVPVPTPAPPRPKQAGEKQADTKQKLFGAFDKMSKSKPRRAERGGRRRPPGRLGQGRGRGATTPGSSSQITRFYDVSDTIPDAERIRLEAQVAVVITPAGQLERARLAAPRAGTTSSTPRCWPR